MAISSMAQAQEIERQAKRVDEQLERFVGSVGNIYKAMIYTAQEVQRGSTDSDLGSYLDRLGSTFAGWSSDLINDYRDISAKMHKYALNTIENEKATAANVRSQIEDINASK